MIQDKVEIGQVISEEKIFFLKFTTTDDVQSVTLSDGKAHMTLQVIHSGNITLDSTIDTLFSINTILAARFSICCCIWDTRSSSFGSEDDWWFWIVVVTEIRADSKLDNLPVMISTDWNKN